MEHRGGEVACRVADGMAHSTVLPPPPLPQLCCPSFPVQDEAFISSLDQAPGSVCLALLSALLSLLVLVGTRVDSGVLRLDGSAVSCSICKSKAHFEIEKGWGWKFASLDSPG